MPTIKINEGLEYDFEDYVYGDTFYFKLAFYCDDKFLVPDDVSLVSFFMDIKTTGDNCGCCDSQTVEILSIGNGIEHGTETNEVIFSKILTSAAGLYDQSVRLEYPDGTVKTRERGTLKIDIKI